MGDFGLAHPELVIALTSAIGTDTSLVIDEIDKQLKDFSYTAHVIKISEKVLTPLLHSNQRQPPSIRANALMNLGNKLRKERNDSAILASAAISQIYNFRTKDQKNRGEARQLPRQAFIISTLKHPDEAVRLRETYGNIFFLVAVNESESSRLEHLNRQRNIGYKDAQELVKRDEGENNRFGQHTRSVFEQADIHLSLNKPGNDMDVREYLNTQITRMLNLLFGHPFITPTFDEYAMFIAYASGLRSADLGRQVGAAIASPYGEIIATGANDVPQYGGGQYWPNLYTFQDKDDGRDYKRTYHNSETNETILGYDANKREHMRIVEEILDMFETQENETREDVVQWKDTLRKRLLGSRIKYLTEYTRAVHAEMAAILACSRGGISLQGATLYCSTFPCHNCAKHIIHTGIQRVVYIEPYPKSKTLELYNDSTTIVGEEQKVHFDEFVGVGPRRFFDLFSLHLSRGRRIIRKQEDGGGAADGSAVRWKRMDSRLRFQATALSYIEKETVEVAKWVTGYQDPQNQKFEEEQVK